MIRGDDIFTRFLSARDHILEAQGQNCSPAKRREKLNEASRLLNRVKNTLYHYINVDSKHLTNATQRSWFPFRYSQDKVDKYIRYIAEDLVILRKTLGLRLLVLRALGDNECINSELRQYEKFNDSFFTETLPNGNYTLPELAHAYCNYNPYENKWAELVQDYHTKSKNLVPADGKRTYWFYPEETDV